MPRKPAPPAKPLAIRSATEAEVRRLFEDLLKQRLPMAPDPVPPESSQEAQALLAKVMLGVAGRHDDDAMRDAGERLAKVAAKRPKR